MQVKINRKAKFKTELSGNIEAYPEVAKILFIYSFFF